MIVTELDKELYDILQTIDDEEIYSEGVFEFCESQEDRAKLLEYIKDGHFDRIDVLDMATMIGIESGTVEGELIEEAG